jgi:hypothetical protein
MSSRHITACQSCSRVIVLKLAFGQGPSAWRLFDCPHCEKTNAALLPSGIAATYAVKDTTMVLHPQCVKCEHEVRLQFTDWDDHLGPVTAPAWECPNCHCANTLPTVGRITSVEPSESEILVR